VRERGDTLHLLAGFPPAWIFPESHTQLIDGGSSLGTLSLDVRVSAGGDSICILINGSKPARSKKLGREITAPQQHELKKIVESPAGPRGEESIGAPPPQHIQKPGLHSCAG
jgi:hypothetical protein